MLQRPHPLPDGFTEKGVWNVAQMNWGEKKIQEETPQRHDPTG